MKIIGLLDCDSFFASCEKVFRPDWANRPVVVLSNNDGCVVARSPEAKALGIAMGAPFFQIRELARRAGVVVRSGNFALYGDLSRRVVETLGRWTPSVDVYSIDEAFLDLTGRFCDSNGRLRGSEEAAENGGGLGGWRGLGDVSGGDVGDLGRIGKNGGLNWREFCASDERLSAETRREIERTAEEIVETVRRWTGIPVSLGLGPTRTLAKAASRIAKRDGAATGRKFALLFNPEERERELKRLPVGDVWGVGRRLLPAFWRLGLRTAFDLARVDPIYMRKNFSIVQEKTVRELRGERTFDSKTRPEAQKSLQISRSFGTTVETLAEMEEAVSSFASTAAAKMRARKIVASGVYVYMSTSGRDQNAPRRNVGLAVNFARPTNSTPEFLSAALRLTRILFDPNLAWRKAGVVALETLDESVASSRRFLFEPDPERPAERRERDRRLCETLDKANVAFGKNAVFFASDGIKPRWTPNARFVSPSYTTDWNALPVVRAN
ncbi:MAG: Y-family DNA polymerase [Thermoguttaceae bacterium]|nr:Y-family DNA polymerase [Thermoguttaceae bacterium]